MWRAVVLVSLFVLAASQSQCPAPNELLQCQELGSGPTNTQISMLGYSGSQSCVDTFADPSMCLSSQQQLYEFDLELQLDLSETGSCSLQFFVDNVPLDQTENCDTSFCNGTQSNRCGFIALSGLTISVAIENIRIRKTLQDIGSFPYDILEITQLLQYTDLSNPAGTNTGLSCSSVCNATQCEYRPSDPTGSYCYYDNTGNFPAAFGPSQFNCVNVVQPIFVPGTPDLTTSCCGDCENCNCGSVTEYVPYYPQSSPADVYQLYQNSVGSGFQLDASTGGIPGNTYDQTNPLFISSRGWPLNPGVDDQSYYQSLTSCPAADPECDYGNGLWLAALRRDPLAAQETLSSDYDGKLACGYCTLGMPAFQACGDPAVPALFAMQTYAVGQTPICKAMIPVDDVTVEFDLVVSITGLADQTVTEIFLDLTFEGQQDLLISGSSGTILLAITPTLQQSPLDDPLVTDSVWVACAPDSRGEDFSPLDPETWYGRESPWSARTGPASGLPNCFGCLPDEQSQDPSTPRLWWYMSSDQAEQMLEFSNVGLPGQNGFANRLVQEDDCDNPVGNQTGCAPGSFVGLQSSTCANGGINSILPPITAASVGRAFASYRKLVAASTIKAIDPLSTDAGQFLPSFYNYQSPNVWLESQGDTMTLVYFPITSPFENNVQIDMDMSLYVDTSLASTPQSISPLVIVQADSVLPLCPLSNSMPPRAASGILNIMISANYPSPTPVNYALQASVGGTLPCFLNGDEYLAVTLQNEEFSVQVVCNATLLTKRIEPNLVFTLTATHGSIISLLYQATVCPTLVADEASPNYFVQPAPQTNVTVMNMQTGNFTVSQNYGPGSVNAYANSLYATQNALIYVWSAMLLILPALLLIAAIGAGVAFLIKDEHKIRQFERS